MEEKNKNDIRMTEHSIDKFMDITQCKNRDKARSRLERMFRKSTKVRIHPARAAQRILRNKIRNGSEIRPTDYYEYDCYRMAVVDGVIITFELKFNERKK